MRLYVENMIVARDHYYLTYRGIQKDVINYGPIEASFDVYDDFPSYKSGKVLWRLRVNYTSLSNELRASIVFSKFGCF